MTRALPSREATLSASRQLIGRGWRPGGTPSYQTRHIPGGGMWPGGILSRPRRDCAASGVAIRPINARATAAFFINASRGHFSKSGTVDLLGYFRSEPLQLSSTTDG